MDMQKDIVIFGAGNYGKLALEYYGFEKVICFVDNSSKKIGKIVFGKPVISFEKMMDVKDNCRIVVATNAYEEIAGQLKKAGIDRFSLYLPQYTKAIDKLSETHEFEGKNVLLFGVGESTEILIEDLSNRKMQIKKIILADRKNSAYIGKKYGGVEVQDLTNINEDFDVIVVASQTNAYILQTYIPYCFYSEIQKKEAVWAGKNRCTGDYSDTVRV